MTELQIAYAWFAIGSFFGAMVGNLLGSIVYHKWLKKS